MFDSEIQGDSRDPTIYLITQNCAAAHIRQLLQQLQNNSIKVNIQKETRSINVAFDRRYFVIVDNLKGAVLLGPQFASLLMFIVGYPRKGENKKNHYCTCPKDVLEKHREFLSLPVHKKTMFNLSIFQLKTIKQGLLSQYSKSRVSSKQKIESVSIFSSGDSSQNQSLEPANLHRKLFLLLAKNDAEYNKWMHKIRANDPVRYKIVENVQELALSLQVCRSMKNYLVVSSRHLGQVLRKQFENLKIIVYVNEQSDEKGKLDGLKNSNIARICYQESEIIESIRRIGLKVLSLKDIAKSIVKYDSPVAKQQQSPQNKTGRKLIWANSEDRIENAEEANFSIKSKSGSQIIEEGAVSQQNKEKKKRACTKVVLSKLKRQYGMSSNNENQSSGKNGKKIIKYASTGSTNAELFHLNKKVKKIKRSQANNLLKKSTPLQLPSTAKAQPIKRRKLRLSQPEKFCINVKILRSKSVNPQFYQFEQEPKRLMKRNRRLSSGMIGPALRLFKREVASGKENNYFCSTADTDIEVPAAEAGGKLVSLEQEYYFRHLSNNNTQFIHLLWKQFNFELQNVKNEFVEQARCWVVESSFYSAGQLYRKAMSHSNNSIILFLDDSNFEDCLQTVKDLLKCAEVICIYVFPKKRSLPQFHSYVGRLIHSPQFRSIKHLFVPITSLNNQHFHKFSAVSMSSSKLR